MKITSKLGNGKWISVDERLPEEGEEFLILYEYFRGGDYNCRYPTYRICHYYGAWRGPNIDILGNDYKVLYWQLLPNE